MSGAAVSARQGWYIRFIEAFVGTRFQGTNKAEAQAFITAYQKLAHDQENEVTQKLVDYIEPKVGIACQKKIYIGFRRQYITKYAPEVLRNPANKEDELYTQLAKAYDHYKNNNYENLF